MRTWTRRSIIGAALVGVPVGSYLFAHFWCRFNILQPSERTRLSLYLSAYPTSSARRALGERFLKETGIIATQSLRRLSNNVRLTRAAEADCSFLASKALEEACCDDFSARRTYCIDGWVLAETELDIAAVCTLT